MSRKDALISVALASVVLGGPFGIPVLIHWSLLLLVAIQFFFSGFDAALMMLLVYGSVLLHEFGHCLVAQKRGCKAVGILMTPIGGLAAIEMESLDLVGELDVALAGPAVSLWLFLVGALLNWITGQSLFSMIAFINLVLLVFNMIPALPMDGGRVFRVLLQYVIGDRYRATLYAVAISGGLCFGMIYLGVYTRFPNLVLIGVFLGISAWSEAAYVRSRV